MRSFLLSLALFGAAAPLAIAQRTVIVQGGPDAFVNAVSQAVHDDVLIVRPGTYSASVHTDQGIAMLCDPGVQLSVDLAQGSGLVVEGLPSGRVFRLRGGTLLGLLPYFPSIFARSNQGTIVVEDVVLGGGVTIWDTRAVGINRCFLRRSSVARSNATFSDCSMIGDALGAALTAHRAEVTIAGGQLRGSDPYLTVPAGSALFVDDSDVTVATGAGMTIVSGNGPVPAITSRLGRLDLDPSVVVIAGSAQAIAGSVTVTRRPVPAVAAFGVLPGQTFTVNSFSEPGSHTHVLLDFAPIQPLPSIFGTSWVSPVALILDSGITPPTGARTVSLTLPPVPRATPVTLQPLTLLTNGSATFGPATLVLLH
jgi:hypothetical protein